MGRVEIIPVVMQTEEHDARGTALGNILLASGPGLLEVLRLQGHDAEGAVSWIEAFPGQDAELEPSRVSILVQSGNKRRRAWWSGMGPYRVNRYRESIVG